jgi:hypothetical protein
LDRWEISCNIGDASGLFLIEKGSSELLTVQSVTVNFPNLKKALKENKNQIEK